MTDTPLTADNWEPSEEMMHVVAKLLQGWYSEPAGDYPAHEADIIIKAIRPLFIAEAAPAIETDVTNRLTDFFEAEFKKYKGQIEAAERERIAKRLEDWDETEAAGWVRALGDSKP